MSLLITICGRGGSKAVPRKNIREVCGIPLIAYTIRHALAYAKRTGADVALSTDSDDIRKVAAEHGLVSDYRRPAELATDWAGKLPVIRHLLFHEEQKRAKKYEFILDLDITSPLRTMEDLDQAFEMLKKTPEALNIFTVSFPTHNPYFDMVEEGKDGFYELVKTPQTSMLSRQQGPKVFDENASFYFYRRAFFEPDHPTLPYYSLAYLVPHTCFEIDSQMDMEFLEYLLKNNKLDFSFQY